MALNKDDYEMIQSIVENAIEKKHAEFWVGAEEHWTDHRDFKDCRLHHDEWKENHKFIACSSD